MVDRTMVSPDGMKYTFTLRDGLQWHDGQPVLSEDCTESLKRWGKKDRFGQLLMANTAKIAPFDKKTFTLELAEPFGPVLEALGKASSNVPFMMPARIASTPADQQIKEVIGSGPFKFAKDEWQPGEQAVYVRNPNYIPLRRADQLALRGRTSIKSYGGSSPTRGTRRMIWHRVRLTGGSSRRWSSSQRLNRAPTFRHF